MNCIIVDDNKIARTTMRHLAGQVNDITIAGDFSDSVEAYQFLKNNRVDIVLLDIEMPGMNGLELTKTLNKPAPLIIFTTAKTDYAVDAFELNVADYIVKPVTPARFLMAIDKAREILASHKEQVTIQEEAFIFIRDGNIIRRIKIDDILFAEAMGDYVKIHTASKFYAIHTTLKNVEDRLPASKFIRVHRSYIAALYKIDAMQDGALVISGKTVPVADAYRSALNSRLNVL